MRIIMVGEVRGVFGPFRDLGNGFCDNGRRETHLAWCAIHKDHILAQPSRSCRQGRARGQAGGGVH